jgi:hypothetical protein
MLATPIFKKKNEEDEVKEIVRHIALELFPNTTYADPKKIYCNYWKKRCGAFLVEYV